MTRPAGAGDLTGKVALVTGAARGQGEAIARRLARAGASVVLGDILAEGSAVAADIGGAARFVELDVSCEDSWAAAVDRSVAAFGGLDIVVNNAGILRRRPLREENVEDFRRVLDVNLLGAFLGMRVAARSVRRGGAVVNVSSIAGMVGVVDQAAYSAAKWGIRGVARCAALELGPQGIRVNTVVPGAVDTAMLRSAVGDGRPARADVTPLQRVGTAEEVAELVAFLASDAAAYLTGAEVVVDGGLTAGLLPARGAG